MDRKYRKRVSPEDIKSSEPFAAVHEKGAATSVYIYLCPDNKLEAGFSHVRKKVIGLRAEKPIKTDGFCKVTPIYYDNVDQFSMIRSAEASSRIAEG